jgi:hypothetical protein
MAKSDPKKTKEIELEPDAMERLERAIAVVVKSPPQHRTKLKAKRTKKVAKRKKE